MKILIADFDLYHKIGGGQTFYQRIIETNPHLKFYYLIDQEKANQKRPKNVTIIYYQQTYIKADFNKFKTDLPLNFITRPFLFASNIAYSLQQQKINEFDIIDYPDYEQYGLFLSSALTHFKIKFQKIVISLHGTISRSLKLDWYVDEEDVKALEFAEQLQYKIADIRYGISKDYIQEWEAITNIKAYYFNPLLFLKIKLTNNVNYNYQKNEKISLNYIGRKEKRKGIDIFINLVNILPKNLFFCANIIGSNYQLKNKKTAEYYLEEILKLQEIKINILPAIKQEEMMNLFQTKSMTFLPSRSDTFNLIALESLFSGCPTLIGNGAGVCRFLEDNFPQIPFVKLDINNINSCLNEVINILEEYHNYRYKLISSLPKKLPIIEDLTLTEIYEKVIINDVNLIMKINNWYNQLIGYSNKKQYSGKIFLIKILKKIDNFLKNTKKIIKNDP